MTKHTTWLWPNHPISKRDSGRLREEHNAAVNRLAELETELAETRDKLATYEGGEHGGPAEARPDLATYFCSGKSCPGLPYRASVQKHPQSCVDGKAKGEA